MLLLFSIRVAEWPPVWEELSFGLLCVSFVNVYNLCVSFFTFGFGYDCINSFLFTLNIIIRLKVTTNFDRCATFSSCLTKNFEP